ncbi:MAG TPA: DNA primase [Hyphomicrobiaceae bacterium]|jgi:DNA primase
MRFPPAFLDEIRARLPVSQVVSRKVALKRKGREYAGLSPFKTEKTPSFFVNDQKGFYHCFASGEHGDIFTFLMKTEGLSFPEAVERLAAEAGVPMPRATDADNRREDQRARLLAVLEASLAFFQAELRGSAGLEARRYLERRGLSHETIARFRLGYAPPGRAVLKDHLAGLGFTPEEMTLSGMVVAGEDIPVSYDRFRHRVMFPITDLRGRVIAFGGRALDPEAPAKYLNSPETQLFHKGAVLFNASQARAAAHDHDEIIVVEGYMDVIAMSQAGFEQTVAPLGTALTEDQLRLLWRMAPEPILCFDGDAAGRRAAYRAIDVAIGHLQPGRSLRFAFLPDGSDPDDLVRQQGPEAMRRVLEKARPLVEVLWEREWRSGQWSTPERRAFLEKRISTLLGRIGDATVKQHYGRALRAKLYEAWPVTAAGTSRVDRAQWSRQPYRSGSPPRFGAQPRPGGRFANPQKPRPSDSLKRSGLVGPGHAPYREALLLRTLLNHPWLVEEHAEAIAGIDFTLTALGRLRDAILSLKSNDISLDSSRLRTQLEAQSLQQAVDLVERAITHKCDRFAEADAERADVEAGFRHALALHERQKGLKRALEAAERDFLEEGSEESLARICEVQRLIASLDVVDAPLDF